MKKHPLSITVVGWLFIATGCIGLVSSLMRWMHPASQPPAETDAQLFVAATSGLIALVGGAFSLRGVDWARWLLVAWMGFHLVLSLLHSALQLLMHVVIFAPLLFLLLRPSTSAYFRSSTPVEP